MFKENYKKANDSLPVNEDLLNKLLCEAEKPVRVIKFKRIYKYGTAFAAALVLVFAAVLFPQLIGKKNSEEKQKAQLAVSTQNDTLYNSAEETEKASAPNAESKEEIKNDLSSNSLKKISKEQLISNAKEETSDLSEDSENISLFALSGGSGGVMRIAESISEDIAYEEIDIFEYLGVFGFDLSRLALPEGISRTDDKIFAARDEDGNIIFSNCVVSFSGDEKNLSISVTQDKAYAENMLKIYKNGIENHEDGGITVYVLCDSGAYIADCQNFSVNEAEALASSLK